MSSTALQKKVNNKWILLIFYIILALYPFFDLINVITGTHFISYLKDIVFTLLFVISLFSLIKSGKLSFTAADYLIYGYAGMVIINLIRSPLPFMDIIHSARYRLLFLMGINFSFKYLKSEEVDFNQIMKVVMKITFFSGILVALIAVLEYFSPEIADAIYGENLTPHLQVIIRATKYRRLISTLRNPINLGFYMVLAIVSGLYLFMKQKRLKRITIVTSLVLFTFVLLKTYSRTAYIAVLCVYFGWYFSYIYSLKRIGKIRIHAAIGWTLFIIVLSIFILTSIDSPYIERLKASAPQNLIRDERVRRLSDIPSEADAISIGDKENEEGAFLVSIVAGHGIGERIGGSLQYVFELGYLSIYYESGLIALLCFMGFVLLGIYKHFIHFLTCLKTKRVDYLALSSIAVLGSFLVTMIAEDTYMQLPYSLYYPIALYSCVHLVLPKQSNKVCL